MCNFPKKKRVKKLTLNHIEIMEIERFDHLVLTVKNADKTIQSYTDILGMNVVTFGDNRKVLTFGNQKINLHEKGKEFEPKAKVPTCGS